MTKDTVQDWLRPEYDLAGQRSMETHYYHVETRLAIHSNKGVLKSDDVYRQRLMVEPGGGGDGVADKLTCVRTYVQRGDGPEVTIPALQGFSYEVNKDDLDDEDLDEQGRLFGIPEDIFAELTDSTGAKLPIEVAYQIYSLVMYYPAHVDYAEPSSEGKGIQHLKRIGDKITLDAAFAETPIPGSLAGEGSVWKNGEVTLEFTGLGIIDEATCAIVSFDQGVCSWVMPMTLMPIMRLKTIGVSFYRGDIYLDLASRWVRKLKMTLAETTVTSMWGVPIERAVPRTDLLIRNISQDEFEKD
ncbi:hypothetical protein ACFLYO_04930 [Chloroflexota bacterium]